MGDGRLELADNSTQSRRPAAALASSLLRGGGAPRRSYAMPMKRGKRWYARWSENGKRRFKSCPTKGDAEALENMKRTREARIRIGLIDRKTADESERLALPVDKAIAAWRQHLERRVSAGEISARYVKEEIRGAIIAAGRMGIALILEITPAALDRLHDELADEGLSRSSLVRYVGAMQELRRFTMNGARRRIQRTAPRQVSRVLTPAEADRLIRMGRFGAAYSVMLFTGLRWNELRRITWSMVDLQDRCLRMQAGVGKTKREAVIPIASMLAPVISSMGMAVGSIRIFQRLPVRRVWLNDLRRASITFDVNGQQANRKCLRKTFTNWLGMAGVETGSRRRLRRDVGAGVMEQHYDDPAKLIEIERAGLERMCNWFNNALTSARGAVS